MLKFVRDCYQFYVSFILWLILIGCVVGGGVLGRSAGLATNSNAAIIVGVFLGLFVGLILIVGIGGYIATIMNIDENLQKISNHYIKTSIAIMNIDGNLQKISNNCAKTSGVVMENDHTDTGGRIVKKSMEKDTGTSLRL